MEKYRDTNKCDKESKNDWRINDLFSLKFCLQILSMLMQHIDEGFSFFRFFGKRMNLMRITLTNNLYFRRYYARIHQNLLLSNG